MAYNWYEYLVFARNLRDNPAFLGCVCKDETIKRNIVSRAYYSAFHHSKKYAELYGKTFSTEHVHSEVQDWFYQHKEKQVYDALRELSKWRGHCDYDDDIPRLNDFVRDGLKDSGKIYYLIKSKRELNHFPPI
jgi:uncharacterized protein (UPF0332 family)